VNNFLKAVKSGVVRTDIVLIIIYLIVELSFLDIYPEVQMDEPWYGNTAFNFANNFRFTNTNVGYSGGDLFCLPSFISGIFIKIFGLSLFISRLSSVLAGFLALIGLLKLLKALNISARISLYSCLLLIFSNVFFIIFRTARPESWVVTFGIWSLYYAFEYFRKKKLKFSIYAGILASLSFLSHPYGLLSAADSGLIIIVAAIRDRKISDLIYFGLSFMVCLGLPVAYCLSNPDYSTEYLIREFSVRNSISARSGIAYNFITFFSNYSLGIKRLYILIFEILACFAGLFVLRKEKILWVFPLLGIFNFVFSISMFSLYLTRSFGQIIIFSIITFALAISVVQSKRIKIIFLSCTLLYFLNNMAGNVYFICKNADNLPYDKLTRAIDGKVPDNTAVAGLLDFWYGFPHNDFYCNVTEWHFKNFNDVEGLIKSNYLDYIVLSDFIQRGHTPTSGRFEPLDSIYVNYYDKLLDYAHKSCNLNCELDGGNYGRVKIWKVIK